MISWTLPRFSAAATRWGPRQLSRSLSAAAVAPEDYVPHHITARAEDMAGNGKAGRYWLVPGSMERAADLAQNFDDVVVRESGRGHHVHIGRLARPVDATGRAQQPVDVGVVSTGMGCPTVDIILTELIRLGAKRLIRIGSAGSLQPHRGVGVGTLVVATGGVRDEGTSRNYAPMEFPSVASPLIVEALQSAAVELGPAVSEKTFTGLIHSKDSLMAREFHEGGMGLEHKVCR